MNIRKITSLTLLINFILLMLTSIILYIAPHGRVAYWSDWHLLGFSRTEWGDLHLNIGILFLVAFGFHFYFNLNVILAYLKNKAKQLCFFTTNFNIALALTLVVCIGTYFMIPPMNLFIKLGAFITEKADIKYGEPPYGHAELSSLKVFAKRVNLDLDLAKQIMETRGIYVENDRQTILQIAEENNLNAKKLYEIMQPAVISAPEGSGFPDAPPPGFGRKTLEEISAEYTLQLQLILSALENKGIKAEPAESLKEIAENNNTDAMALFEIIHEAVTE